MTRAVITGGTSAIGRGAARRLLAADVYFAPLLDYPAEDRWLATRMASAR